MSYETENIANTLKAARTRKGFSQRELSRRAGVPQGHISKIENGNVDLRVSSLVELGRVLGLELMLIPKKSVPAVSSIIRSTAQKSSQTSKEQRPVDKEFETVQDSVDKALHIYPNVKELAQIKRNLKDIQYFREHLSNTQAFQDAYKAVKTFQENIENMKDLKSSLEQIQEMRNRLAHHATVPDKEEQIRPAYSLDDNDDG